MKSRMQRREFETAHMVRLPKIDTLPRQRQFSKIFEMGFEGQCPECNTSFTKIKVYIPVESLPIVGPAAPRQWLREKEGEVFLNCAKRCCLKWIPFRAYVQAYNESLRRGARNAN